MSDHAKCSNATSCEYHTKCLRFTSPDKGKEQRWYAFWRQGKPCKEFLMDNR